MHLFHIKSIISGTYLTNGKSLSNTIRTVMHQRPEKCRFCMISQVFLDFDIRFLEKNQHFECWKSGFLILFQTIPELGVLAGIFAFISTCAQFVHNVSNQVFEIFSRILHS